MVDISVSTGKEDKTIAPDLAKLGTHIIVDRKFLSRKEGISTEMQRRFSNQLITSLKLSDVKNALVEEIKGRMAFVWDNIPEGKAIEKPQFAKKMQAAGRILLRAYEAVLSGASDEDTVLVVNDMIWKADTLVGFTFDTANSGIGMAVAITGMQNYGNQPQDRPASDNSLSKIAQEQREKRKKAAQP